MSPEERAREQVRLIVTGVIFLAIVLLAIPMCLKWGSRGRAATHWPSVHGKVDRAQVRLYTGKGGKWFGHELEYSYSVAQTTYHGLSLIHI